ncbi:MAG: NAD-dependent epimerase/dehydratase family protein [Bacteroidales bacterium]|jgi:nucleoside-diphosphate-sugar epimerase|nr:NAD-dependent epimerase/dehydratase family protein [Bacteroidales bacterium]
MYEPSLPSLNDIKEILADNVSWNYFAGKTVLITGASGFIPSYVVYALIGLNKIVCSSNPVSIIALVRNKNKAEKKFAPIIGRADFRLIIADVSDPLNIAEKIDIIIHGASQASPKYYGSDPVGTLKANTIGTANLLDLALKKRTENFLFISSADVYGVLDEKLEEIPESYTGSVDITNIRSCYAESKRMGENMCVCWSYQYNLHVNMVRVSGTYGCGYDLDDGRAPADFVSKILNNQNIILNSDGKAKKNFVYITDSTKALFRILICGGNRQAYNLSGDSETEILELATMLCELYPEKHLKVEFSIGSSPKGYIRSPFLRANFSNKKLKGLGWGLKVPLAEGFKRMIEAYQTNNCLDWENFL